MACPPLVGWKSQILTQRRKVAKVFIFSLFMDKKLAKVLLYQNQFNSYGIMGTFKAW
jgi:hypothetical protein